MRFLVAFVTAVLAAAPPSGVHHTPAGTAAARRALIRAAELGAGWTAGVTPKKVGTLTCGTAAAKVKGVVETGAAISPTYRESASGPFISQAAYVYTNPDQAASFWGHVAGRGALACLAESVAGGSTKDVGFTVSSKQSLKPPAVGTPAVAYRVVGRAVSTSQTVAVYVDVMLFRHGNTISELSFSSFQAPPQASLELRVARAVANRL